MNELTKLKKLFEKIEAKYEKEKSPVKKARLLKKAIVIKKKINELTF